ERVAAEHAERLKIPRCSRRLHRIPASIDCRTIRNRVLVVGPRKESEDALACLRCEDIAYESLPERIALFIDKDEEKSLVLDDRPAETPAKLSPVFIILFDRIEIVEPVTGVERGITVVPEEAAAELICSGSFD